MFIATLAEKLWCKVHSKYSCLSFSLEQRVSGARIIGNLRKNTIFFDDFISVQKNWLEKRPRQKIQTTHKIWIDEILNRIQYNKKKKTLLIFVLYLIS